MPKLLEVLKDNLIYSQMSNRSKLLYISNLALISFEEFLIYQLRHLGVHCEVDTHLYNSPVTDIANHAISCDAIIINLDPFAPLLDSNQRLAKMSLSELVNLEQNFIQLINQILKILPSGKHTIFIGLINPQVPDSYEHSNKVKKIVSDCNLFLERNTTNHVDVFNLQIHIESLKIENVFKKILNETDFSPYEIDFIQNQAESIAILLASHLLPFKKIIVLDCDNTLWGGVAADLGWESILFGNVPHTEEIFLDLQELLKDLNEKGVLLALCSKNEEHVVLEVFERNKTMRLGLTHFVSHKINWEPKSFNIINLCKELNILPDSVIFIDDSLFEIREVMSAEQKITCIQAPTNIFEVNFLKWKLKNFFPSNSITSEDIHKTKYYQNEQTRQQQANKFQSYQDYLISLETCINLNKCSDVTQISRIAQMSQKTNQFNFTFSRYNEESIHLMLRDDRFQIFTGVVSDNVGDNGLVYVLVAEEISSASKSIRISELILSCRVFGRDISETATAYILKFLQRSGFENVYCTFKETTKNLQFSQFLPLLNFQLNSTDDNCYEYFLNLSECHLPNSSYPKIEANF